VSSFLTAHQHTKVKTETRECKTKTETETDTKKLLWDRDQKLRDRDQSSQFSYIQKLKKSVCFYRRLYIWN